VQAGILEKGLVVSGCYPLAHLAKQQNPEERVCQSHYCSQEGHVFPSCYVAFGAQEL
jgi:hypothetical protein